MPVKYWLEVLSEANVPCGPVNDIREVTLDPQVKHRNMIRRINQSGESWQVANTPFKFSNGTTGPSGSSPDLGEHTEILLRDILNISSNDLNDLRGKGIV
jgi:crotonobetainyl-CoA:carnitine CoA-transferase CaiB-like acyl-CoA transferase